jgi:AbrB family looped-hinge helix DNA binding protein
MPANEIATKITDGGRIVIPAEYRKALGINVGDEVIIFLEKEEIRVVPRRVALQRAQEIVRRYAGSRSLASELIQERRQEAEYE